MKRTGDLKETKEVNAAVQKEAGGVGENDHDNVTGGGAFSTTKLKLTASYVVPIMFIILIGIISFFKASEVIESRYEKTTEASINMAAQCMKVGFESIQASAAIYTNDSLFQKYSLSYDDRAKAWQYRDDIASDLASRREVDELIKNMYLINEKVEAISTGEGIDDGLYNSFMETDLGKILDKKKTENVWDGEDEFLDKELKTTADNYSMRLIKNVINVNGILIIDVKADFVKNILSDLKFDKDGFLGLVTPDGKEMIDYSLKQEDPDFDVKALKSEKIFVDQAFYKEAMDGEEVSGSKYVDYKGSTYLFMYSKISDTGAVLCALLPKATISSQADSIKNVTMMIVVIACMITILIAAMLSPKIDRTSKNIIS
jgi:methyl-accepting chemotaxis protein